MELLRWSAASGGPSVCFPVWHRRGGIDKGQVLSHVQSIKLKQEHGKFPNKSAVELILMTVGSAFMVGWPWDMHGSHGCRGLTFEAANLDHSLRYRDIFLQVPWQGKQRYKRKASSLKFP